jgi:hypothetical protein
MNGVGERGASEARGRLAEELREVDPVLASMYELAVGVLEGSDLDRAAAAMIGHAVREISNRLPHRLGLVEGVVLPERVDTTEALDGLARAYAAEFEQAGLRQERLGGEASLRDDPIVLSPEMRKAVELAVAAHLQISGNAAQKRAYVASWEPSAAGATTAMFGTTFAYFMSYAHLDKKQRPAPSR